MRMTRLYRHLFSLTLACLGAISAFSQMKAQARDYSTQAGAEHRTERALEAAKRNPLDLRAFLVGMPKGGDLHMHLEGAVYAETWVREGAEDRLCVDMASLSFAQPAAAGNGSSAATCAKGDVPAAQAYRD